MIHIADRCDRPAELDIGDLNAIYPPVLVWNSRTAPIEIERAIVEAAGPGDIGRADKQVIESVTIYIAGAGHAIAEAIEYFIADKEVANTTGEPTPNSPAERGNP